MALRSIRLDLDICTAKYLSVKGKFADFFDLREAGYQYREQWEKVGTNGE